MDIRQHGIELLKTLVNELVRIDAVRLSVGNLIHPHGQ